LFNEFVENINDYVCLRKNVKKKGLKKAPSMV